MYAARLWNQHPPKRGTRFGLGCRNLKLDTVSHSTPEAQNINVSCLPPVACALSPMNAVGRPRESRAMKEPEARCVQRQMFPCPGKKPCTLTLSGLQGTENQGKLSQPQDAIRSLGQTKPVTSAGLSSSIAGLEERDAQPGAALVEGAAREERERSEVRPPNLRT